MHTFKITKKTEIVCNSVNTRSGFRHTAKLLIDGVEVDGVKICYQNRTWEQYEYQDVIHKLLDETTALSDYQKKKYKKFLDGDDGYDGAGVKRDMAGLNTIAAIAKMGNILAPDQKAKNDWKKRMLTAGLGDSGLIMPDNWSELSETEKELRLNGAIKQLSN